MNEHRLMNQQLPLIRPILEEAPPFLTSKYASFFANEDERPKDITS